MPFLNEDQVLRLKNCIRLAHALGRTDFAEEAMTIHQEGLSRTEKWLQMLHHRELAAAVRKEAEEEEARSRSWVNRMVEKCRLALRAGEPLEEDRAKWGKTAVVRAWFTHYAPLVEGMDPRLVMNSDEVGVAIKDRQKLVCLEGCRLFRLWGKKLPHVTVFPVFNCYGEGPPPFIVLPEFVSAQTRFRTIHQHRVYVTQSKTGWVTHPVFKEWTQWVCRWLDKYREERNLVGHPVILFVDNAPTRRNREAMDLFRRHNVRVILFPPHLTHVLQPVDWCWAKPFKAKVAEAWHRYNQKADVQETAFRELGENMERAPEKHRVRVRLVYSIGEAYAAVTVPLFASQGFWHTGLCPWRMEVPLASAFITEGEMPGPLPLSPFEQDQPEEERPTGDAWPAEEAWQAEATRQAEGARRTEEALQEAEPGLPLQEADLFDWATQAARPGRLGRFLTVPRPAARRRQRRGGRYSPRTIGTTRVAPLGIGLSDTDSDGDGILLRADQLAARIGALDVAALAGILAWTRIRTEPSQALGRSMNDRLLRTCLRDRALVGWESTSRCAGNSQTVDSRILTPPVVPRQSIRSHGSHSFHPLDASTASHVLHDA